MADKSKFWYLKNFSIFDGMDDHLVKRVSSLTTMKSVESRSPIYFPDEPSRAIFFLKQGHVKISRMNPEGKEVILDVIGPGELFGELALSEEESPRSEIAETLDEAVICAIKRDDFESLLRMNPDLNLQITKRVGLRLRKIEERVSDLVFKDVKKRIATFLVRYAEEFGKVKHNIVSIRTNLTHQEIAFLTGSSRQTVTSTLDEFRKQGLLDFSRVGFVIKDLEALQQLSR